MTEQHSAARVQTPSALRVLGYGRLTDPPRYPVCDTAGGQVERPPVPTPTATKVTFTLSLPQSLLGVGGGAGTGIKDRGIIPLMETL